MTEERKKVINKIRELLKGKKTFLIAGHIRPDGDTIGSQLALATWLKSEKKDVEIVNNDPTPEFLKFLEVTCGIVIGQYPKKKSYDVGIILECPNISRVGDVIKGIKFDSVINIDHHIETENICAGECNLIDPKVSSCAELVYHIMSHACHKLTKNEAICLYAGIVTDTGKFQQANTTPEALKIAAELLKKGVDTTFMYKNVYGTKSLESLKFLGMVLSTLKIEGTVAYLTITGDIYKKCNAKEQDSEDLINYAGMLPNVKIFALFRDMLNRKDIVKISLRSYGNINVNSIAKKFGGGGHFHASGFELKGKMDGILKKVLAYLKRCA